MIKSTPSKSRSLARRGSNDDIIVEDDDRPDFDFDFSKPISIDTFSIEPKIMKVGTPDNRSRRLKLGRTGTGTKLGRKGSRKGSGGFKGRRGFDSPRGSGSSRSRGSHGARGSIKREEKKITVDSLDLFKYKSSAVKRQKKRVI